MFRNLQETIKALNADVKTVANCEKAKKLRTKLLSIGLPLAICGFVGVFVCFALFATAGLDGIGQHGFSPRILVPFLLFIPCGVIGSIGSMIAALGFKIVITGYTTELIDETVGNHCPDCGETIDGDMKFCPKCGTALKRKCPVCQHANNHDSAYCAQCGTKLDE